jgi:hypothetical protein
VHKVLLLLRAVGVGVRRACVAVNFKLNSNKVSVVIQFQAK